MRLDNERQSSNVEDMRGRSGGIGVGGLSLGAVVLALAGSFFFGIDPGVILGVLQGNPTVSQSPVSESGQPPQNPPTDPKGALVSRVLASTEDAWTTVFSAAGDRKVYIDLQFYELMRDRFKVAGDFAQAYVIAHEVGHHVQNLLGITDQFEARRGRVSPEAYNALSVRLELQADCFAGVWANRTEQSKHFLDPGDVDGALKAATAIGDDTLQQQTQGRVVPDSFTHGTSAQRVRWLRQGLETGDVKSCDTFKAREL